MWICAYLPEFACNTSWWRTAATFAPIGTAGIALCAALIAWHSVRIARDTARRRAAIDLLDLFQRWTSDQATGRRLLVTIPRGSTASRSSSCS
jgi:hypothetical protein